MDVVLTHIISEDAAYLLSDQIEALAEEQIAEFQQQREKNEDEDEVEDPLSTSPLKFIEHTAHLVWLTLCYLVHFRDLDLFTGATEKSAHKLCKTIMSQVCVPTQAHYDNFLSLVHETHFDDSMESLRTALIEMLQDYEREISADDTTDDIRDHMRAYMEKLDVTGAELERGCHVYASMFSTVDSKNDPLAEMRWRECYMSKCKAMVSWLKTVGPADTDIIKSHIAICHESALLVPFVMREELFRAARVEIQRQVHDKMLHDKKLFDMENDHSGIESDFKCPKCGSFKTQTFLIQVRSADEPMTQFWKCWSCMKSGNEN